MGKSVNTQRRDGAAMRGYLEGSKPKTSVNLSLLVFFFLISLLFSFLCCSLSLSTEHPGGQLFGISVTISSFPLLFTNHFCVAIYCVNIAQETPEMKHKPIQCYSSTQLNDTKWNWFTVSAYKNSQTLLEMSKT